MSGSQKGGEKEMTRKLPWATAAVIIVVAAIGAWALWGQAPAAPPAPPTGAASIGIGAVNVAYAGGIPETSGIENVYIMDHANFDNTTDLSGHANILEYAGTDAVITGTGVSVDIPYDTDFDIVVAIKVDIENVANLQEENVMVELAVSGEFTIALENSLNANEYDFLTEGGENIYLNVVWDNATNGYQLGPGGTISLNPINLWLYK